MAEGETPEGTVPNPENPPEGQAQPPEDGFDEARARETIRKQRESERAATKRAEVAEKRIKELETAQLSDSERTKKELEDLRAERTAWVSEKRAATVERAVLAAASTANAIEPTAIADLLRGSSDAKFDADGNVSNAKELVDSAKAKYPKMFGAAGGGDGGSGGKTNGQHGGPVDMNVMIRRAAGR